MSVSVSFNNANANSSKKPVEDKLFLLMIILIPLTFRVGGSDSRSIVSVADLLLPFALVNTLRIKHDVSKPNYQLAKQYLYYSVIFVCLCGWSPINIVRYNGLYTTMALRSSVLAIAKASICLTYGYVMMHNLIIYRKRNILRAIATSGVLAAVLCIGGVLLYRVGINTPLVKFGGRGKGLFDDPNQAGIYLLAALSVTLVYAMEYERRASAVAVIELIAVLVTASKGAILTAAIAFTICIAIYIANAKIRFTMSTVLLIMGAIILLILLEKYTSIFELLFKRLEDFESDDADTILTNRASIWRFAFSTLENPTVLLFGIGYGMFKVYMIMLTGNGRVAHNTNIAHLVELGVVGELFIIIPLIYVLLRVTTIYCERKDSRYLALLFGVLSVFIYMNSINLQYNRLVYILIVLTLYVLSEDCNFENVK